MVSVLVVLPARELTDLDTEPSRIPNPNPKTASFLPFRLFVASGLGSEIRGLHLGLFFLFGLAFNIGL